MVLSKKAKKDDIIKHITEVMGLAVPDGATVKELLAFVVENGGEVEGSDDTESGPGIDAASGINLRDRVNIRIQKTSDKNGGEDVFVGVNGVGFLIKRGVTVSVPMAVVHGLRDAVTKQLVETLDANGDATGAFEYQDVQTYPFEILN
jgi:hypothetical protein